MGFFFGRFAITAQGGGGWRIAESAEGRAPSRYWPSLKKLRPLLLLGSPQSPLKEVQAALPEIGNLTHSMLTIGYQVEFDILISG